MEYSNDQIPFLDILIKRNESSIWMNLYHKPTDTQRCLTFTSSHPNLCKRNTLFCSTRSICAIAENNTENLENIKSNLSKYHHPNYTRQGFQKPLQYHKKTYENLKNCQMKTSCHSLQHLIQIILNKIF